MLNNYSHIVLATLEDIGGSAAVAVAVMHRYNDFSGLQYISSAPSCFNNPLDYFRTNQALALFTKREDLSVRGIDKKKTAINKWFESEHGCYVSNERLSPLLHGVGDRKILAFVDSVRAILLEWLGHRPPREIEGRYGPGATYSDRGRLTTVPDKMTSVPTLTTNAYWYILPYLGTMWGRHNASIGKGLEYVRGNRFTTVPKNFKTDRGIAIEPSINVFYQLGLGTALRDALKASTKWDLSTAQDVHRREALEASLTGEFATLDLSSASDTVCYNLVKLLLPPRWFAELDALRSPCTLMEGKWVHLEKFSSMGNGYTFELETIIFAALSAAWLRENGHDGILGSDMYIYGDDIIVPSDVSMSFVSVLNFFGFKTNLSKTFHSGPFRESCGADYWDGFDVRPWFCKETWSQPLELFKDLNGMRKAFHKISQLSGSPPPTRAYEALRREIPLPARNFFGPEGLGDIVIHSDSTQWRYRWKHSIREFRSLQTRSRPLPWNHWKSEIVLACAVYGVGDGLLGVTPRNPASESVQSWVPWS